MAIRKVVQMGDEILRKKAKLVVNFDEKLWTLLDDMKETMYSSNGMGFAANQVGVLKQAIIVDVNNSFIELVNPQILKQSGSDTDEEGCLSCGKVKGLVERPLKVTVKAQDRMGYEFTISCEKYLARCLCHEIDHLNGVLFIDKIKDKPNQDK